MQDSDKVLCHKVTKYQFDDVMEGVQKRNLRHFRIRRLERLPQV